MVIFAAKKKGRVDIASAARIALGMGYFADGRHAEFR